MAVPMIVMASLIGVVIPDSGVIWYVFGVGRREDKKCESSVVTSSRAR